MQALTVKVVILIGAVSAVACSGSTAGNGGSGGNPPGSGGTVVAGGSMGTGGKPGNGGATGEGQGGRTEVGAGGTATSRAGTGGRRAGGSPGTGGRSASGSGGATGGGSVPTTGGAGGQAGRATGSAATGGRTRGTGGVSPTGGSLTGGDGGAAGGGVGSGGATGVATACCRQFGPAAKSGQIAISSLNQLSGMVASRAHPGVMYAHLDTGTGAAFYVMTVAGASLGSFALSGATATDWEDIAVGPGPTAGSFIFVGDIGDNAARTGGGNARSEIQVYRVPEPDVDASTSVGAKTLNDWQRLRFTYPDKAHDAETLMVDPVTGDILIITKESNGASQVLRAAGSTPADTPTVLELLATLSLPSSGQGAQAAAGDISPSGESIILRTYTAIWLWCRASSWASTFGASPTELPSASEQQSEGLTFAADGQSWYSAGETSTAIYQGSASCGP